ncbi:MAG: S8 family serine peptidase [Candidatus Accumulibacter sp.]|nr:S8 family serine peptidase [Accumulibacter sp.]
MLTSQVSLLPSWIRSCLLLLIVTVAPPVSSEPQQPAYVPGRLLIQQRAGLSDAEVDKSLKPHGAKRIGKIAAINVHIVQLPATADASAVATALSNNRLFKYVERDRILAPAAATNDPSLPNQWHLAKIGAPMAWNITHGNDVTIAILDTGVDDRHPDLAAQMVPGWNAYDHNADASDVHGHGTAVAGTAAATGNNALGVASVAYGSKIMPIRISDPQGYATVSAIAAGLVWAADHGARVASISHEYASNAATIDSAAQYFKGKEGLTIAAAGNRGQGENIVSTGNMVIVSATDRDDRAPSWSSFGTYINIAAPGQDILTTTRGGGYGHWSGTSVATAVVAGTTALMMAANPALSTSQIQSILYSTAVDLGGVGKDEHYGAGRVDAAQATRLAAATPSANPLAPTVTISAPAGGTVGGLVLVDVAASHSVSVARVELAVNGKTYATDTTSPHGFVWDTTGVPDGVVTLTAYAYDAAGNYTSAQPVRVMVANSKAASPDTPSPTQAAQSKSIAPPAPAALPTAGANAAALPQAAASEGAAATVISATSFSGRGWYVDSVLGNDQQAGTLAQPWKTLARATQNVYAAGDALLLKCGSTWRETTALSNANAPAGGLVIGSYGSNCSASNRPKVSGADLIGGVTWTIEAGFGGRPVYVATWPKAVKTLYWNGTPMAPARHPNFNGVGQEFALVASVLNASAFKRATAEIAAIGSDLVGATVYVRSNPWAMESREVLSSSSDGTIATTVPFYGGVDAGEGYFFEGKLALLDSPGEWHYDAAAKRLYVWTPTGQSPVTGVLESGQRPNGLTIWQANGTRIENIVFERQLERGLFVIDAPNTQVTDVVAQDAGLTGIEIVSSTADGWSADSRVTRALVRNAGTTGISITGPRITVTESDVEGTGMGPMTTGVSSGIHAQGTGITLSNNRISDSSFAAISLSNAGGMAITGNTLLRACRRLTDCGALYSAGTPSAATRTLVSHNTIKDMTENVEGAVGGAPDLTTGIYLDQFSANHDVTDNMISNVGFGIKLHNSANNVVRANRVWLSRNASIRVHNSSANETVRGNIIEDNELFASSHYVQKQPNALPMQQQVFAQQWLHSSNASLMFTGSNPNIVRRNSVGTLTAARDVRWNLVDGWSSRQLDASGWAALTTGETVKNPFPARLVLPTGSAPNLVPNGDFQAPGDPWWFYGSGSMSYGGCSTGCGNFQSANSNDLLLGGGFRMSTASGANLHYFRLRAEAVSAPASLTAVVLERGGTWQAVGPAHMNVPIATGAATVIETLFTPGSSAEAALVFTVQAGRTMRIHEVSVVPLSSFELFSPMAESTLLTNDTSSTRAVTCAEAGMRSCTALDLAGNSVSWPVTLPAFASRVVVSADAKWRQPAD